VTAMLRAGRWLGATALALLGVLVLWAQPLPFGGHVTDFSVPDFYPPPNQNQIRSMLRSAEAEPLPGGLVRLKDVKLDSYQVDGVRTVTIFAPDCIYDTVSRTARSAGALRIESGDGQVRIEGTGFLWQQTNSVLIISNQTRTTLTPAPRKSTATNS
jgi:hypothetical protein